LTLSLRGVNDHQQRANPSGFGTFLTKLMKSAQRASAARQVAVKAPEPAPPAPPPPPPTPAPAPTFEPPPARYLTIYRGQDAGKRVRIDQVGDPSQDEIATDTRPPAQTTTAQN
jgi:hypothetical protein